MPTSSLRSLSLRSLLLTAFVAGISPVDVASQVTRADYERAESRLAWNALPMVRNASVVPRWIGATDRFWYVREIAGGKEFVVVDPARNTSRPAFDHARLATALSRRADSTWTAESLPFDSLAFTADEGAIEVHVARSRWRCDLTRYACERLGAIPTDTLGARPSPDGRWEAFARDHDLYLRATSTGEITRLTTDGAEGNAWGRAPGGRTSAITDLRSGRKLAPDGLWSRDSKRLLTFQLDERGVGEMYLLQSARGDSSYRPRLWTYRYAVPGDSAVPKASLAIVDAASKRVVRAKMPPFEATLTSPIGMNAAWWDSAGRYAYVVQHERGMRAYRVVSIDAESGETRTLIEERGPTLVEASLVIATRPNVHVLRDGTVLGFSERSGWAHLYHFDGANGAPPKPVTQGEWVVRELLRVDEGARAVLFMGAGREPGSNPYYRKLYRAALDGSSLQLLTPEDGDHRITLSPSGRFFVDRWSRVDKAPVSVLRASDGRVVRVLEEADVSRLLASGWRWPRRFTVKGADGVTDLSGVLFLPTNFDSTRKYPVLDDVYPGPQTNHVPAGFVAGGDAQALAELGFVVAMIDGRGTPFRSKAFHDYQYGKLELAGGLEDHVAGLTSLAKTAPYLDLTRVGIYGHSGGGYMSARAMMMYPDFYKVAVSSAGNHDQRGYIALWGETYMGLPVERRYDAQANASLAKQLKGKLLLAYGDLDDNVQPALTLQLIDALTKANRDYDLLVVPNENHIFVLTSTYFTRRRWDYFVRWLHGVEPPPQYEIRPPGSQGIARVLRARASQ